MNILKRKITSERGASITFALLIFLVCSMVSIAVVIAGTTAAGRMSQRAETDQRYYAVTSAVELLCDDFKDKTVTVEYNREVKESPDAVSAVTITEDGFEAENPMVAKVSKDLVLMIANETSGSSTPDGTFTLTASTDAPADSSLACAINEYVKPDGRVIFEVSNTVDPTAAKKQVYTLQVTFDANIRKTSYRYAKPDKTLMEKVTVTLDWSLNNIKKGAM